jgi:hypothetical protein
VSDSEERTITENTTEARAGATPHVARYVLLISLFLIVAAFATLMTVYR